jgi:phosphatidylglycerophosphate synthase
MDRVDELLLKGDGVEEWIDLHFFRPLGSRLARALSPTGVTADQITLLCLVVGLAAGHLMAYASVRLNLLGLLLFIVSDVFDSTDGQLARLRGTSSPFGRLLDGLSDHLRFLNLYLHLMARLILSGHRIEAVALTVMAGVSHALQSTAADFIRNAFLEVGEREGGELVLPGDEIAAPRGGKIRRVALRGYRDYVSRQARMFPASVELIRRTRAEGSSGELRALYRQFQQGPVTWCALVAQNVRFLLLAVSVVPGWPAGFFILTIMPLNLALVFIRWTHERNARLLLAGLPQRSSVLVVA